MNYLHEMTARLCPDGVPHKELCEVAHYASVRIASSEVNEETYVGVENLLQNKAGKTSATTVPTTGNVIAFSKGDILIGNIRPYLRKIWLADVDGGTNGDVLAVQIYDRRLLAPEFLYYILSSEDFFNYDTQNSKGAKMPRGDKDAVMRYKIPVPPIAVQREIVQILDNFSELTAELTVKLTTELKARKQQYEYYTNSLLRFNGAQYYSLAELCDIVDYRGKTPMKSESGIFLVTAKNIRQGYIDYEKSKEYIPVDTYDTVMRRGIPKIGDVLITTEAPCGYVAQVDRENIALAQRVIKYRPKCADVLNATFLKYILLGKEFQGKLEKLSSGGTVKGIKGSILHTIQIPVPDVSTQKSIVEKLERFDSLCHGITSELSAEIEARQKQYEYYKDRLLTFKELR